MRCNLITYTIQIYNNLVESIRPSLLGSHHKLFMTLGIRIASYKIVMLMKLINILIDYIEHSDD